MTAAGMQLSGLFLGEADPSRRSIVLGVTGTGKTRAVQRACAARMAHGGAVMVIDPKGEYHDLAQMTPQGCLAALVSGHRMRGVAVVPSWQSLDSLSADVALALDSLRYRAPGGGPLLVVVEECGLLRGEAREALEIVATVGRAWGVELCCVAQRATQVPATVRAQASMIASFRQTHPADLEALEEIVGEERALAIRSLPRYKHVTWTESDTWNG